MQIQWVHFSRSSVDYEPTCSLSVYLYAKKMHIAVQEFSERTCSELESAVWAEAHNKKFRFIRIFTGKNLALATKTSEIYYPVK